MTVISASVRTPDALPIATSDSASRRESSSVFMNAPLPVLTSRTSPPMPSAIFLLMIDARDQRDALDRAGHVAQRVQRAVRGRDLGGLADQRAADRAMRRAQFVERECRCGSRGSIRACRACRRCGRGRAPTSSAHARRRRPRAARGPATSCRRRRRCCACRPGRRADPDTRRGRRTEPWRRSARRSPRRVMPRSTIAISSADGLIVGNRAVGDAGNEEVDLARGRAHGRPASGE